MKGFSLDSHAGAINLVQEGHSTLCSAGNAMLCVEGTMYICRATWRSSR
jgi:hypothetical protein